MTDIRELFPNLPERIIGLGELAENLRWSWQPRARMLFKMLDRQAWKESGHNPDKMLREIPAILATLSLSFCRWNSRIALRATYHR